MLGDALVGDRPRLSDTSRKPDDGSSAGVGQSFFRLTVNPFASLLDLFRRKPARFTAPIVWDIETTPLWCGSPDVLVKNPGGGWTEWHFKDSPTGVAVDSQIAAYRKLFKTKRSLIEVDLAEIEQRVAATMFLHPPFPVLPEIEGNILDKINMILPPETIRPGVAVTPDEVIKMWAEEYKKTSSRLFVHTPSTDRVEFSEQQDAERFDYCARDAEFSHAQSVAFFCDLDRKRRRQRFLRGLFIASLILLALTLWTLFL